MLHDVRFFFGRFIYLSCLRIKSGNDNVCETGEECMKKKVVISLGDDSSWINCLSKVSTMCLSTGVLCIFFTTE